MVEEAKNILIGKSCYDCAYLQKNNICSIDSKIIPEEKSCPSWSPPSENLIEKLRDQIVAVVGVPKEYLYGKKNNGSMAR